MALARPLGAAQVTFLMRDATRAAGLLGSATAYHLAQPGAAWRLGLALDCSEALDVSQQEAALLAAACELVHQASVVHDDVQDAASSRRGRESVSARYGMPAAICVGDHLLASVFPLLSELPRAPALVRLFTTRIAEMAAGQANEFASDMWPAMTLSGYRSMIGDKAGAAIALPIEGASLLSGASRQDVALASQAGRSIGMAYQAGDDVSDIAADLRHGSLNGALAHLLDSASPTQREEWLELLARAKRWGLPDVEAAHHAARLGPQAAQLMAWARDLLAGLERDMAGHPLCPTLAAAAARLALRLETLTLRAIHAA